MTLNFKSAFLSFDEETLELVPDKTSSSESLYVDFTSTSESEHRRFKIFIHPKKEVVLKGFELHFSVPITQQTNLFYNGFQPNHPSDTYQVSDKIPSRGWLVSKASFYQQTPSFSTKNSFHSWHYGYLGTQEKGIFIGSLNETTAYTGIKFDRQKQTIVIRKDIHDLQLSHSFPLLDLMIFEGKQETYFANYFSVMDRVQLPVPLLNGWMANKNKNGNSTKAISSFLELKEKENITADLVLIGAGYAKEVGDWLYSSDQFPEGLPPLISRLKEAGLQVGMNISPLLCSSNSDVYKQNSDWILKDGNDNSVTVKTASGTYYVLDAYHPGVQDSLQVFCYRVINQWGVDLLKFDHLSLAFATARKTKTRAQAGNDFLKMLRDSCYDCLIWASDIPLATSWPYANYTSATSNFLESWDTRFPLLFANENDHTAKVQLKNILHRFNHNQYGLAANIVSLGPENKLTIAQQYTNLIINALFSNISIISDAPDSLSPELWSEWQLTENWKTAKVRKITFPEKEIGRIDFENKGKHFYALVNFSNKEANLNGIVLSAGESMVLGSKKV